MRITARYSPRMCLSPALGPSAGKPGGRRDVHPVGARGPAVAPSEALVARVDHCVRWRTPQPDTQCTRVCVADPGLPRWDAFATARRRRWTANAIRGHQAQLIQRSTHPSSPHLPSKATHQASDAGFVMILHRAAGATAASSAHFRATHQIERHFDARLGGEPMSCVPATEVSCARRSCPARWSAAAASSKVA